MPGVRRYGALTVRVQRGDLTRLRVDAIVNAASSALTMGGGVAGAIRRVGGAEIEEAARRLAPVPVGAAVSTGAGALPCRWVIHAPTMPRPGPTTAENVHLATAAALREAERIGARSVAFPGLGTGVGGVSYDGAAQAMLQALTMLAPTLTGVQEVWLVDIDTEMIHAWEWRLARSD
jgi:O-acetyl-ADP-ribose deacetylase (regulator of RNase III)